MDLTNDDVQTILRIVDDSGYHDVCLEIGDFKLHVQKQPSAHDQTLGALTGSPGGGRQAAPAPAHLPVSAQQAGALAMPAALESVPVPDGVVAVTAPILGTYYAAPAPGEKPFIELGSKVAAGDTLCLIEVMKLFNAVKADVAGTVVKILAENGSMVEHGQVLVYIQPEV